ncbi:Zn-dependent oxidoreductase [Paraburkholderia sp. SIMBA_053]|uniref:Zn-dependent oxidoreductase n=1 Tax=Paraburkholderia sp. SIMBA_053 TaxID=3085794 RepID=UPI003979B1E5
MKAICVTAERNLEIRDVPFPEAPPSPGHVFVDIDSATITHGDKFFLTRPLPGGSAPSAGPAVYGANASGRVTAIGNGVPTEYLGRQVAIYKSLARSPDSLGVWCEMAQLPYSTCLMLPDELRARDYCGSFANVLTVYAFLSEIRAAGHKGIVVTAGTSATGLIAASLTQRFALSAIFLVRSAQAGERLMRHGVKHVLVTTESHFENELCRKAAELEATAVFDGVGGDLLSRTVPNLPIDSTIYVYGFLGAASPASFSTMLLMGRNLTIRRFSNLESLTVKNPAQLAAASKAIEGLIHDPLFRTNIGKEFRFDEIDDAMSYETSPGRRAILVP